MRPSAADAGVLEADNGVIDVTRLRVALARLSRRLRRHQLAGLTPTQLAALSTVELAGPIRLGDLAAAEGIAPSTLTRMVAVLEELGYVRRDADPRDARASTLAITPIGHDTLERLRDEGTALLTHWLMLLGPEQRAAIATALPALEALGDPDGLRPSASSSSTSSSSAGASSTSAASAATSAARASQNNSKVS
jgi:DNA-binding MarR family transcriptional regulator